MAAEYAGVKTALKKWIVANCPTYFSDDNTVWTFPPKAEEIGKYPIAVILVTRMRPRNDAGIVVFDYIISIGFVTKDTDSRNASATIDTILKEFDTAWADATKTLDSTLGSWMYRRQLNVPGVGTADTDFSPVMRDDFGVLTYEVSKTIVVGEKIAARAF